MKLEKLNENYSVLITESQEDREQIERIHNYLKVFDQSLQFDRRVQYGMISPYKYFSKIVDNNLIVFNGHLWMLDKFNIQELENTSNVTDTEIDEYLEDVFKVLPFKPYDYQINNVKIALKNNKVLSRSCTSSGKSCSISLILEFFRRKGYKGLLVVPNINLLTQFKSDIKSYNLNELYEQTLTMGDGTKSNFSTCLTITTWQSIVDEIPNLDTLNFDFIICDEAHRFTQDVSGAILNKSLNTKIKLGFTGTLNEDKVARMNLYGIFGKEHTIITARELIERGLGTKVSIKSLILNYPYEDKCTFNNIKDYAKQLKYIKEYGKRTKLISHIACQISKKEQNCLVLYQHTEHGKEIFRNIMQELYGDVKIEEKDISGKKSLEFQKQYKVFFMNGDQDSKTREYMRLFMEDNNGVILVGNYSLMSTGTNIKNLHSLILGSPLKAFTTVSQSLGRLMRKHPNKKESIVYDIVDNFGIRRPSGIFYKQYTHRKKSSYESEEFPITELTIEL